MIRDIKYLIEDIVNFNPVEYDDNDTVGRDVLNNIL